MLYIRSLVKGFGKWISKPVSTQMKNMINTSILGTMDCSLSRIATSPPLQRGRSGAIRAPQKKTQSHGGVNVLGFFISSALKVRNEGRINAKSYKYLASHSVQLPEKEGQYLLAVRGVNQITCTPRAHAPQNKKWLWRMFHFVLFFFS